jgi:ATP-dependent Clp protease ATP-binding subunit ClpC
MCFFKNNYIINQFLTKDHFFFNKKYILKETHYKFGISDILFTMFNSVMFKSVFLQKNISTITSKNNSRHIQKIQSYDKELFEKYTNNLTEQAKSGKFQRIIGRDTEMKKIQRVLMKRTKRNPLLLGEAGVGKTALIEELSRSLLYDDHINNDLKDFSVLQLDVTSLMAGSTYRGEMEERLIKIIDALCTDEMQNTILFIDEIHMLTNNQNNVSSSVQTMNIAQLLKPVLARGRVCCIGATTYDEYIKFFKKDEAFDRRFQTIDINEPSKENTYDMIIECKQVYQEHYKCIITKDAVKSAISLAGRYLPYRNFPDKALDLIDEACSCMVLEEFVLLKNKKEIKKDKKSKKKPLVKCSPIRIVDVIDIEKVMTKINGVDLKSVNETEIQKITLLKQSLNNHIFGQDHIIEKIDHTFKRLTCGLHSTKRPLCSMLFCGPSGVGKTETAKLIANEYFGNQTNNTNFVRFDMSEYMEQNALSSLIGAPPGYVGYDEGGKLTKSVKNNPFGVFLFDEIEKAHPDVLNILLQILDEGILTDAHKKKFSFKNTIIIMTSNATSSSQRSNNFGFVNIESNNEKNIEKLQMFFKPEFLNRIDQIMYFNKIDELTIRKVCNKYIEQALDRVSQLYRENINVIVSDETYENIIQNVLASSFEGARPARNAVDKFIVNPLADELLNMTSKSLKESFDIIL